MTWIKTIPPHESTGPLQAAYEEVYGLYPDEYRQEVPAVIRPDGGANSIVASLSLIPQAMRHAMSGFGVLMSPELPLSRRQHEMIATLVSALNQCFY